MRKCRLVSFPKTQQYVNENDRCICPGHTCVGVPESLLYPHSTDRISPVSA